MQSWVSRSVAIVALVLAGAVAIPGAASADQGPVNWTKITTPSKTFTYHVDSAQGAVNHLTVSGQAGGSDFSTVDIFCAIDNPGAGVGGQYLARNVPVTDGKFTVTATVGQALGVCRLRAVPSNIPDYAYLGSFSGPIMYSYTFAEAKDGTTTDAYAVASAFGSGDVGLTDASECGVLLLATVTVPDVELRGPAAPMCAFALPPQNSTDTGTASASTVRVDGKNAYMPGGVEGYLRGTLGLDLSQPGISTSFSRNSSTGEVKVTESERLRRCDGDNTFPPTAQSCASLVNTGVTFKRTLDVTQGNHQVLIHDEFVSNDGDPHQVTAQYNSQVARARDGAPGYIYPNHTNSFKHAAFDKVVTGFGTGPASVLVRSDVYATSTEPQADTQALTWSRPPPKIQFSHDNTAAMSMPYGFHVSPNHVAKIGFAVSEAPLTADAKALAGKAAAAL